MKRLLSTLSALILAITALPALSGNNQNAFAEAGEPHAVLRFSGSPQVRRMAQVYLWKVDGQRVLERGVPAVYLKPGTYTLQFRARGIVNRGHVPPVGIAPAASHWKQTDDTLKAAFEAGKVYYIAAKPKGNGAWKAVIWKTGRQD